MSKHTKTPRSKKSSASRAPTLIDVARVAGVSPITVSRVLNQPSLVSEEAQARVRRAVEEIGYVPNMLAGGLASRSSRMVALIVPTIANSIFAETVQAITDTLAQAGYQTLLGISAYEDAQEQRLLEAILGRRPDGIILTGTYHSPETRKRLQVAGVPVVETWDLGEDPIDTLVGFSHTKVGEVAAEYLLARGHRKFAAVSATDQRAEKRLEGFLQVLTGAGVDLPPVIKVPTPARFQLGREAIGRMLDENNGLFDAVYCSSDTLAHGVIVEAQQRCIRIPDDMAVIGFGDLDFAGYTLPTITSIRVNGEEIGYRAAQVLLARMTMSADAEPSGGIIDTGFSVIERQSA